MVNSSGDTEEMTSWFCEPAASTSATQPGSIDPGALRRAMKLGQKARAQFGARSFRDVEKDLRKLWEQRGEAAEWEWVRAAVRAGFEPESIDDD
jgi:hypothetical protein